MPFDWLVIGQLIPLNSAHAVRGPRHSVKKGKTSVLSADEMGALLASIDTSTLIGLRDRALIALMGYTFARVGAAIAMKVEDYYVDRPPVRSHRARRRHCGDHRGRWCAPAVKYLGVQNDCSCDGLFATATSSAH
jgi:integrase